MTYIRIRVFPSAKKDTVIQKSESLFEIYTREAPVLGNANKAALALLAVHLKVFSSTLRIIRGGRKPQKIVGLLDGGRKKNKSPNTVPGDRIS